MKLILTIIYILFTTTGLTLMKVGGKPVFPKPIFGIEFGLWSIVGIACYGISFLIWQKLLHTFDLTYIVPITTGIVQIIVLIIGIFIFKENIHTTNIIGIILIIIGVILTSSK